MAATQVRTMQLSAASSIQLAGALRFFDGARDKLLVG